LIHSSSLLTFGAKEGYEDWNRELKKITDIKFRRAGRFSQAVLSGALSCLDRSDEVDFTVYFGTANGDVDSTIKSQDNIFLHNRFPLPFSFINTLSNTPLFFLLQHLGSNTLGISLAHSYFAFENALSLAFADLNTNRTKNALVGVCDTWYEPIEDAFRLIDKSFYEFSAWILIDKDERNFVRFFDNFDELLESIKQFDKKTAFYFSPYFDENELKEVEKYTKLQTSTAPRTITNYAAAIACEHFSTNETPLFYIGKDLRGGYSFISIYK